LIALLLTFVLFGAPAAGFWLLVGGLDPIGRLVVASLASMVVVAMVAAVMLVFGAWDPLAGFAIVLLLSAGFAVAGRRWRGTAVAETGPAGSGGAAVGPAKATDTGTEGDEWIFES